jgi:hypothetical protein
VRHRSPVPVDAPARNVLCSATGRRELPANPDTDIKEKSMRMLILGVALAFTSACGPSIQPQMKAATDRLAAESRGGSHDEGAPRRYEPMKWQVGQWTLTRAVNEKGEPTVTRMAVVGREDGGYWIESETQDYYRRSVTKMLYAKQPATAEESFDALRKIVLVEDGKAPTEMDFTKDDPGTALMKRMYARFVRGGHVTLPEQSGREDATVAAGRFRACATFDTRLEVGPFKFEARTWFHPAVPLGGTVKGVSTDGKWKMEILDFGLSGATSRL